MVALLPLPEVQLIDANGHPYVAGTLMTLIPGTDTPKDTWANADGTVLNTNPIVLDSAGRAIIYGDGQYRVQAFDASGNLIYDQLSSTIVSAAMAPVMLAPTIAEALRLLGVQDLIDNEAATRAAADNAITASLGGYVATAALNAETARAEAAEATLQANIDAETARAEAAEAAISGSIPSGPGTPTSRTGTATTDALGHANLVFDPPFSTMVGFTSYDFDTGVYTIDTPHSTTSLSGLMIALVLVSDGTTPAPPGVVFHWISIGY